MNTEERVAQIAREIRPCRHMARWVDSLADDSLHGLARWYVQLHINSCRQCHSTLLTIRNAREQLLALRNRDQMTALSATSQSSLSNMLDDVEHRRNK